MIWLYVREVRVWKCGLKLVIVRVVVWFWV